jgi:hypothetical protein
MQNIIFALANYVTETRHLDSQPTSTENTFYPAIKALISAVLKERRLPFEVRVNTAETKSKARDLPDFVLGDDKMFVGVYGEVKRANVLLEDLALSTEQNDHRSLSRSNWRRASVKREGLRLTGVRSGLFSPGFGVCPARQAGADQDH